MLQFNLRPDDRDLLVEIVRAYLGDLRLEIGDTSSFDYRSNLKAEEKTVRGILDILTRSSTFADPGAQAIL